MKMSGMKTENLCDRMRWMRPYANDANDANTIQSNTKQCKATLLGRSLCPNFPAKSGIFSEIFVSLFENYFNPAPVGIVPLREWLLTSHFKKAIEMIRNEPDKSKRRELKAGLPAITPSGIFSKRCATGLIQHSGIVCIDIDQEDNPHISDFTAITDRLTDISGLLYIGLSVGGKGLFLLVRIANPKRHEEHFHALADDLKIKGITIDGSCKDLARLRGVSYDPLPFYNPNAGKYEKLLSPVCHHTSPAKHDDPTLTERRVGLLVAQVDRTNISIADDYPTWYAAGRSLAAEFGEYGREWYHAISKQSSKYQRRQCDEQYTRCLQTCSRTSISTFFGICKRFGLYAKT